MSSESAWDEVIYIACSTYSFLPNEHSKESAFFLMFGRVHKPLVHLLSPRLRYAGNNKILLALDAL